MIEKRGTRILNYCIFKYKKWIRSAAEKKNKKKEPNSRYMRRKLLQCHLFVMILINTTTQQNFQIQAEMGVNIQNKSSGLNSRYKSIRALIFGTVAKCQNVTETI